MHTSGKTLNAYNKIEGVYVYHLPLKVDEEISISSQKNVTLRTIYTMKTQTHNKQAF